MPADRLPPNQKLLRSVARWALAVHGQGVRTLRLVLDDGTEVQLKAAPGLFGATPRPVPPQRPQERRSPPGEPTAVGGEDRAAQAGWRAGIGFRSVRAGETVYSFTEQQARAVELLWREWLAGTPDVPDAELLRATGSDSTRLNDVFRNCPAWGTWISEGGSRGTHRLGGAD